MEYFFYCRDNPGSGPMRMRLAEAHWSFMDDYAPNMIARGPTLTEDGESATGSMHIVDLPDAAAAQTFAYDEPNYKAGVYGQIMVRRWENVLGRTMWNFEGAPEGERRFLVIGHYKAGALAAEEAARQAYRAFLRKHDKERKLILGGPLLSDDLAQWVGTAMLLQLPSYDAVEKLLANEVHVAAGLYESVEIHHWRFGGRPAR